jgi:hypothetical protein
MASRIDDLVDVFAAHLAHKRGQSVAELRPFVRTLFTEAMQEYREAGAPLGQSDEAFLVWLDERRALAKSA